MFCALGTCSAQHRPLQALRMNSQRLTTRRNFQKYGNDLKKKGEKLSCIGFLRVHHAAFLNKSPKRKNS